MVISASHCGSSSSAEAGGNGGHSCATCADYVIRQRVKSRDASERAPVALASLPAILTYLLTLLPPPPPLLDTISPAPC